MSRAAELVSQDSPSDDLPEGWVETCMSEVAEIVGGGTPKASDPSNFSEDGSSWITPADLSGFEGIYIRKGKRDLSEKGLRSCSAAMMPARSVLMSSRAPIGYLAIAAGPLSTNQGFKSFVCREGVVPEYVYFWLRFIRLKLEEMGSGSTFAEISGRRAKAIPIFLPPAAEQHRIAAALEQLLPQMARIRNRLARVPKILKRFRQSVLAAACSGRLTEDWRASNQRADWSCSSLGERGITARIGPFGSLLHRADYAEGGVPLVNPTHMRDGAIYPSTDCAVAEAKVTELSAYRLRTGDIVVGRRGEMGRAAVVQPSQSGFLCGTGSMFIRVRPDEFNPEFLCLVLRSPQSVAALGDGAVGSTMQNLNQKALAAVSVPNAALIEQAEVVRRAKVFFGLADAIERRVVAAAARIETLTQAILAKAFRGKLVPTEAELARHAGHGYEPAAELLSRVRAQREKPANGRAPSSGGATGRDEGTRF